MASFITNLLLPMGLAGSLGILCMLALRPVLALGGARLRRLGLAGTAALFLLPFPVLVVLLRGPGASPTAAIPMANAASPLYTAGETLAGALAAPSPVQGAAPTVGAVLPALSPAVLLGVVYLLGVLAVAGIAAAQYILFLRRLRLHSSEVQDPGLLALHSALCEEIGIKKAPLLLKSAFVSTPLLLGWLRPRIVLPQGLYKTSGEAQYALRHELTHHKHGDIPLRLLVQAAIALHWYNPLAWLLRRELAEACEARCDEAVAAGLDGNGRKAYAMALLHCAGSKLPYAAAGFASPAKRLKKRLHHLLYPKKQRRGLRPALALGITGLLLAGTLAGCSLAAGAQGSSLPNTPDAPSSLPEARPEDVAAHGTEDGTSSTPPTSSSSSGALTPGAPTDDTVLQPLEEGALLMNPVPGFIAATRGFTDEHKGIDIKADEGANVVAAAAGVVVEAEESHWSYGGMLVLDHGGGVTTLYAHCSKLLVQVGDVVTAGTVIAEVGSTGNTTGNALHFEVVQNGERIDPVGYLPTELLQE